MNETQLERVIIDFWERDFDVLVCTTIVETGLDIANANTLIVENADKFGLSQLYQLRGRVGRSKPSAPTRTSSTTGPSRSRRPRTIASPRSRPTRISVPACRWR